MKNRFNGLSSEQEKILKEHDEKKAADTKKEKGGVLDVVDDFDDEYDDMDPWNLGGDKKKELEILGHKREAKKEEPKEKAGVADKKAKGGFDDLDDIDFTMKDNKIGGKKEEAAKDSLFDKKRESDNGLFVDNDFGDEFEDDYEDDFDSHRDSGKKQDNLIEPAKNTYVAAAP